MEQFNKFIQKHFYISLIFLGLGLFFGIIYSINLLGFAVDSATLLPSNIRSLHISLMLYGFVPLMLSYLPFLLINKEVGYNQKGLYYLNLYTIFWYIFLIFMISALVFGNTRGLAFYDFPYELNFILAFAGLFYIFAIYHFIKEYKIYPMWVKVCLKVVIIAPITLLILMNPIIGQVESTISGPHGDNTLGMSLALIPIYYLIIKLLSQDEFKAKWNILWIIPTFFYFGSVLHRIVIGPLSYNEEWFLQWLTFLYVPILYRWYKDAKIEPFSKKYLLISIVAFLFVDIEGNILFVPDLRWAFHRNDLVVAHAHVAMGIGVFFMVIAMFAKYIKPLNNFRFSKYYLVGLLGIFTVLSLSGLTQAGFASISTSDMWILRSLLGIVTLFSLIYFINLKKQFTLIEKYNLFGTLTDGGGGLFLLFFASFLYPIFGFSFDGKYEYIVFSFVCLTGVFHLLAFLYKQHTQIITNITVITRVFISSVFLALYFSKSLGIEALLIASFDLSFVIFYLVFIYQKERLCKIQN